MIQPPRMRNVLKRALLMGGAAALFLPAGCNQFDPTLYEDAEKNAASTAEDSGTADTGAADAGDTDAANGGDTGVEPAENWSAAEDWCPLPDNKVLSSDQRVHSGEVSLNTLVSDVNEVPKATGLTGPDGVIGLKLAAQERVSVRYEFAKKPGQQVPDVDLAMYLMGSCGTAGFIRRNDRCPAGQGEDMWWQMNDAAATYYLGFDSKGYDQALIDPRVKLTVSYPRYGDGVIDEGEACDDSNKVSGDGCTHDGLWELKYTGSIVQEKEPNDHPWGANVVILGIDQTMIISGLTGGTCDNDFFALDIPEGAFPRVTMLDGNGQDCPASVGNIAMQFNRLDGTKNVEQVKLGDGTLVGNNKCPSWTEASLGLGGLPAGRYVVEIKGFEVEKPSIPYRLKIEMVTPL